LGSSPFPRRYSGNPILVSSPPPTWMFPFGGFPLPGLYPGAKPDTLKVSGSRKSHSEIPGSKPACGYPGLFAACHVLLRRPSRGIHRPAYSGLGVFLTIWFAVSSIPVDASCELPPISIQPPIFFLLEAFIYIAINAKFIMFWAGYKCFL